MVERRLGSLSTPFSAVVIGATGGIGAALVETLAEEHGIATVLAASRSGFARVSNQIKAIEVDISDEHSIEAAAADAATLENLRLVVVATGLLHDGEDFQPEKSYRHLDPQRLARSFAVNAIGPAIVAKHFLPLLPRSGKAVFAALSARVGSISDNRLGGWYGYRAAKAALNQLLATAAVETRARRPETVIAGLHPGTVATPLSAPYRGGVSSEALFEARQSASFLLDVIDRLTPADSGGVFAWDGQRVPA